MHSVYAMQQQHGVGVVPSLTARYVQHSAHSNGKVSRVFSNISKTLALEGPAAVYTPVDVLTGLCTAEQEISSRRWALCGVTCTCAPPPRMRWCAHAPMQHRRRRRGHHALLHIRAHATTPPHMRPIHCSARASLHGRDWRRLCSSASACAAASADQCASAPPLPIDACVLISSLPFLSHKNQ